VLHSPGEQQIEVYGTASFKLQQRLSVAGLSDSWFNGLTSCVVNNCLYVNDYCKSTVYKIDLWGENAVFKWRTDDMSTGLSVNSDCNLLLSSYYKLLEYTPTGSLVKEVCLLPTTPWHTIQLASDQFVVCKWDDVVEVNSQAEIIRTYKNQLKSTTHQQFWWPCNLAVNRNNRFIFVADQNNDRIVMLSRSLTFARELQASFDGSTLRRPQCLHLQRANSSLFVSEAVEAGRIFVFDIRRQ
jgi:hypothetical protein